MTFDDALSNMLMGKRLVRPTWQGYYVSVLAGQNYMWTVGVDNGQPKVNANIYVPSVADIQADDWMVKV